jgi:hypothetical protein
MRENKRGREEGGGRGGMGQVERRKGEREGEGAAGKGDRDKMI